MTAENKLKEVFNRDEFKFTDYPYSDTLEAILLAMQEHTKIKCQELLEIVAEKAEIEKRYGEKNKTPTLINLVDSEPSINKNSILNAVDLDKFIV